MGKKLTGKGKGKDASATASTASAPSSAQAPTSGPAPSHTTQPPAQNSVDDEFMNLGTLVEESGGDDWGGGGSGDDWGVSQTAASHRPPSSGHGHAQGHPHPQHGGGGDGGGGGGGGDSGWNAPPAQGNGGGAAGAMGPQPHGHHQGGVAASMGPQPRIHHHGGVAASMGPHPPHGAGGGADGWGPQSHHGGTGAMGQQQHMHHGGGAGDGWGGGTGAMGPQSQHGWGGGGGGAPADGWGGDGWAPPPSHGGGGGGGAGGLSSQPHHGGGHPAQKGVGGGGGQQHGPSKSPKPKNKGNDGSWDTGGGGSWGDDDDGGWGGGGHSGGNDGGWDTHGDNDYGTNDNNNWGHDLRDTRREDPNQGWGHQGGHATSTSWGAPTRAADPPATSSLAQGTSWKTWGAEAQRLRKVTYPPDPAAPPAVPAMGTRNVLDVQQQSQIIQAMLSQPHSNRGFSQYGSIYGATGAPPPQHGHGQAKSGYGGSAQQPSHFEYFPTQQQSPPPQQQQQQQQQQQGGKKNKKNKKDKEEKHQSHTSYDGWGDGDGDGWGTATADAHDYYGEMDDTGWGRKVHFSRSSLAMDHFTKRQRTGSYSIPSRTMTHASQGMSTPRNRASVPTVMSDWDDFRFLESHGAALQSVELALFGTSRMAKDRIHWMFPPDKDDRVSSTLAWVHAVSYELATWGLQKFLQTRERGAIFISADYRPVHLTKQPVLDWMTFEQLQPSKDRILQESVAFYDPATQVIVFVFLPSKTGNSMAMWRRKIKVTPGTRSAHQPQLKSAIGNLRKDYIVHVDELPNKNLPPPPAKKHRLLTKRKWWKIF